MLHPSHVPHLASYFAMPIGPKLSTATQRAVQRQKTADSRQRKKAALAEKNFGLFCTLFRADGTPSVSYRHTQSPSHSQDAPQQVGWFFFSAKSEPKCSRRLCSVLQVIASWLASLPSEAEARLLDLTVSVLLPRVRSFSRAVSQICPDAVARDKNQIVSRIYELFQNCMLSLSHPSQTTKRTSHLYRNFFGNDPAVLLSVDAFKDHVALTLGNDVFCALTDERPRAAAMSSHTLPKKQSAPVWPTKVSSDFAKRCVSQYRELSNWAKPLCCAVCSRASIQLKMFHLNLTSQTISSDIYAGFELLRLAPTMMHYDNPAFNYAHPALGHIMLCRDGVSNADSQTNVTLNICNDCKNSLKEPKMPRHALMNCMFVGRLPDRFNDVTWLEEQIVAQVRSTLHVFRLYRMCLLVV